MNNQNENDNRTGNSINPNFEQNQGNNYNMNGQLTSNTSQNYNQQSTINNQLNTQSSFNANQQINSNMEQQNYYGNQSDNLNNVNSEENKKNSNSKKIIIIVAVIIGLVILVPLVLLLISYITINSVFDNTKSAVFVHDAKSYIINAKSLVETELTNSLFGGSTTEFAPTCSGSGKDFSIILLDQVASNTNIDITSSPFGGTYNLLISYIRVVADKSCKYSYYIYLTDDTYSLGSPMNPVEENEINSNKIVKK